MPCDRSEIKVNIQAILLQSLVFFCKKEGEIKNIASIFRLFLKKAIQTEKNMLSFNDSDVKESSNIKRGDQHEGRTN